MGFMDKLKSMASAITGGSAEVSVEIVEPTIDRPFTVNVQAVVGDNDLKIDKVYLKVVGVETVKMEIKLPAPANHTTESQPQAQTQTQPQTKEVSRTENTHQEELVLEGPQTLSAEQTYTWSCQVALPADALPFYQGIHAKHEWKLMAGLSAFGNDPDSGWEIIAV